MNLKDITEFVTSRGYQNYSSARTIQHLGSIKEHSPMFRVDLSRPDYVPYRAQIDNSNNHNRDMFEAQGEVTGKVLDDFLQKYKQEEKKADGARAFASDVLSDDQLGVSGSGNGAGGTTTQGQDGSSE